MIPEEITEYAERHSMAEDELLLRLNRETHLKTINPRMLAGKLQGQLLQMISSMIRPKNILEIGTFTGYSAICLTRGAGENCCVHTIEKNPEVIAIASRYFEEAGLDSNIKVILGDALTIIPSLEQVYDLIYLDADKEIYDTLYKISMEKLKPGAFLIADNALWDGKVVMKRNISDKETDAIMRFNETVTKDTGADNVLLPLFDGIMMVRKKSELLK